METQDFAIFCATLKWTSICKPLRSWFIDFIAWYYITPRRVISLPGVTSCDKLKLQNLKNLRLTLDLLNPDLSFFENAVDADQLASDEAI